MALGAMSFSCILCGKATASEDIVLAGHRF